MATNDSVNVGLSGVTGSGNFVGANTPTLISPLLGTPTSGTLTNCAGLLVPGGGTGLSSATVYAVLCGGTTSTGAFQSIASVGSSGQVLTSNGAGALPTFQAAGSRSGGLINVQYFTSGGVYTPTSGMAHCIIQAVGGGGAGGGCTSGSPRGSGGGSGGYSQSYVSAATIGASQTVTIGAGGTGASGAVGGNGGATSVGSIIIANGGTGGGLGVNALGGAGATAGTGDIAMTGNAGALPPGASSTFSGNGAGGFFGGGVVGISGSNNGNNSAANTGGGGSGGNTSGASTQTGGNGGSGIVIVYEYA